MSMHAPRTIAFTSLHLIALCHSAAGQIEERRNTDVVRIASQATLTDSHVEELPPARDRIVERTNELRKAAKLEPLLVSETLGRAAQAFANFMARTNRYGHMADGRRPSTRTSAQGYESCLIAENIAYLYGSEPRNTDEEVASRFVAGWEESAPHRQNMLNPHLVEMGIAVARSEDTGTYFAVQVFGRPASLATHFEIENKSGDEVEYTIDDESFTLPPRFRRVHERCMPSEFRLVSGVNNPEVLTVTEGEHLLIRDGAASELIISRVQDD
jgi:uncharacterized protein YkwD